MRKRMLWASFLAGMLGACTVYAKEYSYGIQMTIPGVSKFELYEDSEGKIPYKDENGEEVIIQTQAYGGVDFNADKEEIYCRQISTPDGYYYFDEDIHQLTRDIFFMEMQPINVSFSSDSYPVTFQIKDENENIIAQWEANEGSKASSNGNEIKFQAGKKYTLTDIDQDEECIAEPLAFEIPRTKQEDTIQISYVHVSSGTFEININDEDHQPLKDVKYQLYDDEACTKASKDIDGNEAVLLTDVQGNASVKLPEGIYYLKQTDIDAGFYRNDDIRKIEIRNAETSAITQTEKKISLKLILLDAKTKEEIDAEVHISSNNEENNAKSGDTLSLKRGVSYRISDSTHPSGYYPLEAMEYTVPETEPKEAVITLIYVPYSVQFSLTDADTNAFVKGAAFQILNASDEEVLSFTLQEDVFTTSALEAGNTYTLHQSTPVDGFTSIQDTAFSIPASASVQTEQVIDVNVQTIPYVHVHTSIMDNEYKGIKDGLISLYMDAACTKEARDLEGNTLTSLGTDQDHIVRSGTYYAKVTNLNAQYYLPSSVKECSFDHTDGLEKSIVFQAGRIQANIQIVDDHDQPLIGAKVDVLSNDQEVIHSFTSTQDNTEELSNVLERGQEYYLRVDQVEGTYTYEKKDIKLSVPLDQPEEVLTSTVVCTPYISLNIKQKDHFGNTIGVYEDEDCLVLAKDISGEYAKKKMNSDGTISWQLREGTYYLKETEASENCYLDEEVKKIVLDSAEAFSKDITHQPVPVALKITIKDENGKALSGAKYEIRDLKGKTITTISEAEGIVSGDVLKPNQTYIIHEVETPNGYRSNQMDIVYTVPEQKPNEVENVEISYNKNADPKTTVKTSSQKTQAKEEGIDLKWIFIPIGVIVIAAGIVVFKNRKEFIE